MAGFLSIFGSAFLFANTLVESAKIDADSKASKDFATRNGNDIYYDGYHVPHWTENNEVVIITNFNGCYEVRGAKSNKLYKSEKSEWRQIEDSQEEKLIKALKECKVNNIKYLPWYFPNEIQMRDKPFCTGIEVDTGKKYCCIEWVTKTNSDGTNGEQLYKLIYLEDKPHQALTAYGTVKIYDAIHDCLSESEFDNKCTYSREKHTGTLNRGNKNSWYYTKTRIISQKEGEARRTPLDDYPYVAY